MEWWETVTEAEAVPDMPAGKNLEAFCRHIGEFLAREGRWQYLAPPAMAALIAQEFREFFRLTVPVRDSLERLMRETDCAWQPSSLLDGRAVSFDRDASLQQWILFTPAEAGLRESVLALRGLGAILFWRLHYRARWWPAWRLRFGVTDPRRFLETLAYCVALPPAALQERAVACGLNVWQLSRDFLATPSACFYGLRRLVRLPCPYFIARLNFSIALDQQQILFEEGAVRARVWSKFLAKPAGSQAETPSELDTLHHFPRQDTVVEVGGWLLRALKERRPALAATRKILGLRLLHPVCVTARPNGAGTQLLLYAVPVGCQSFLMDEALRAQQEMLRSA